MGRQTSVSPHIYALSSDSFLVTRLGFISQELIHRLPTARVILYGWAFASHTGRSTSSPHNWDRGFGFALLSTCPQVLLLRLIQTNILNYGELLDRIKSIKVQNLRIPELQDKWGV